MAAGASIPNDVGGDMRKVVVVLIVLAVIQHGCAALTRSPDVDYDLTFRPVNGMRLAYDVTVEGRAAGERTRQSLTKVIRVVTADTDGYSIRFAVNGSDAPYLVTLDWAGGVKSVTPDAGSSPSPTTEQLAEAATLSAWVASGASNGPWQIGATRELAVNVPSGAKGSRVTMRTTLRRITSVARRPAAELTFEGVGTIPSPGAPITMRFTGTQWTDLRTGALLLSTITGDGRVVAGDTPLRLEMKVEERLNIPASTGL
jgi:hypothetical protein